MDDTSQFKQCSCGASWASRDSFVQDTDIKPIGMTVAPTEDSPRIYYFFNHLSCKSTLAVDAEDFADLIEERIPENFLTGTDGCPGHCTTIENLETCNLECYNAPFRRFFVDHILKKTI